MSSISIIGSGGMAAAIGGLAARAGHTVELMSRDGTFEDRVPVGDAAAFVRDRITDALAR